MKKETARLIAGVDEVGRGPLAGPVVAAAVILNPDKPIEGLMDSKKLTEKRRDILAIEIRRSVLAYGFGRAEVAEIDRINIFQASLLAMQRAVAALPISPTNVLIDGKYCPNLPYPSQAIIKGDQLEASISAASIIAKVLRDAEMQRWHQRYPEYGFAQHKGYGTKMHIEAINTYGINGLHRRSFAPVRECVA